MTGLAITLVFCVVVAIGMRRLLAPWLADSDPAEAWGVAGLVGLGGVGFVTFFLGLVPGGFSWGLWVVIAGAVAASGWAVSGDRTAWGSWPKRPDGAWALAPLALGLLAAIPLVNALAPSTTMDWDTLAYHLAVPKLWLAAGQIETIPYIHHSFFPFVVDNLFLWGLTWGDQPGAKAFTLAFFLLGILAVFGFARRRFSPAAGWWAALAFAGAPVVLWESGSGYIDVAHGLFAGLGILYAFDEYLTRRSAFTMLPATLLGLGAASKYTGLQTIVAVGIVLLVLANTQRRSPENPVSVAKIAWLGLIALVVASPWLIRNAVTSGNPVYPFFYERFGGKWWDSWRAEIYRDEQQTFGIGRTAAGRNPVELPHGILGLAYQPGRYINPGQTEGLGFPMGALGAAGLLAGLFWLASGRSGRFESSILATILVSLVMWYFLSQQSRYLTTLVVPWCVLLGGGVVRLRAGPILAGVAVLQAGYGFWLLKTQQLDVQLPVVLGRVAPEAYLKATTGFYGPSRRLNEVAQGGKVALFDEVFGYFLDVPYFWANPGHSTLIPYDTTSSGADFVAALRSLGVTHVYVNLQFQDRDFKQRWLEAMNPQGRPFDRAESEGLDTDLRTKWKRLLAEASSQGLILPVYATSGAVIWEVRPMGASFENR